MFPEISDALSIQLLIILALSFALSITLDSVQKIMRKNLEKCTNKKEKNILQEVKPF